LFNEILESEICVGSTKNTYSSKYRDPHGFIE